MNYEKPHFYLFEYLIVIHNIFLLKELIKSKYHLMENSSPITSYCPPPPPSPPHPTTFSLNMTERKSHSVFEFQPYVY